MPRLKETVAAMVKPGAERRPRKALRTFSIHIWGVLSFYGSGTRLPPGQLSYQAGKALDLKPETEIWKGLCSYLELARAKTVSSSATNTAAACLIATNGF